MENPIKMDDLGGKPTIFGNIHIFQAKYGKTNFNASSSFSEQKSNWGQA